MHTCATQTRAHGYTDTTHEHLLLLQKELLQKDGDKEIDEHPIAHDDQEREIDNARHARAGIHVVKIVIPVRHRHHLR